MTNMGWKQLKRIVQQKLSPLYVSVHATDPDKRNQMLLYGKDDYLLKKFEYLTENGIELHSQVVLCPGWNDGSILEKTIKDIYQYSPMSRSMSIVPVGLTKHRSGLPSIPRVTKDYAKNFIPFAQALSEKYYQKDGKRFVLLSDEWFLLLGMDLPPMSYYSDFDLSENGVGQVSYFWEEWQKGMNELTPKLTEHKKVTVCTGTLVAEWFQSNWIPTLKNIKNLTVNHIPIENQFYGVNEVTVSGLLVGKDIVQQLKDKDLGDLVILSNRILNEDGLVTLDDMTLDQLSNEIGTPVVVSEDTPQSFFSLLN